VATATTTPVRGRGGAPPVRAPRASVPSTVLAIVEAASVPLPCLPFAEGLLCLQPRRLLPLSLRLQCAVDSRITPRVASAWSAVEAVSASKTASACVPRPCIPLLVARVASAASIVATHVRVPQYPRASASAVAVCVRIPQVPRASASVVGVRVRVPVQSRSSRRSYIHVRLGVVVLDASASVAAR
jgi:hypothetical protein